MCVLFRIPENKLHVYDIHFQTKIDNNYFLKFLANPVSDISIHPQMVLSIHTTGVNLYIKLCLTAIVYIPKHRGLWTKKVRICHFRWCVMSRSVQACDKVGNLIHFEKAA